MPAMALVTGDLSVDLIAAAEQERVRILHKPVQAGRLRALLNHIGQSRPE